MKPPSWSFSPPKEGDPSDYVRIKLASGKRVTITNSCAANVLGLVKRTIIPTALWNLPASACSLWQITLA